MWKNNRPTLSPFEKKGICNQYMWLRSPYAEKFFEFLNNKQIIDKPQLKTLNDCFETIQQWDEWTRITQQTSKEVVDILKYADIKLQTNDTKLSEIEKLYPFYLYKGETKGLMLIRREIEDLSKDELYWKWQFCKIASGSNLGFYNNIKNW